MSCLTIMKRLNSVDMLLVSFCLIAGCSSTELKSHWRNREIVIDGKNTEWRDSLITLDDQKISVGLFNDENFLYIGLLTTDRDIQRQITRRGVTFWFDRNGGEEENFGIHYPIGFRGSGPPQEGTTEGEEPEVQRENPPEPSNDLEVYGPGEGERHKMTIMETSGIEVKLDNSGGVLVYEIKIPLTDAGTHPFTVGAKAGSVIGVGLETSSNRGRQGSPEGSTGEGGGRMRGGRGGGGRGGGRRGGAGEGSERSGSSQPEPLKVWAKVQLAEKISPSQ